MKPLYFLIAVFACLELAIAPARLDAARPQDVDEAIEQTLEELGEELGEALEELAKSLGGSADQMGDHFEKWAEQHAEEIDQWSEKYAQRWETWANGLERRMERLAEEQEASWGKWAKQYEAQWERWASQLENEDVDPEIVGELVKRNLKKLAEMPIGKTVDQLVKEGLGELSNAPWESLDELGALARSAAQESLDEFAELAEQGSSERAAVEESLNDLRRALDRAGDQVERRIAAGKEQWQREAPESASDATDRDQVRAQIRGLQRLLERDDLSRQQKKKVEQALATLTDAAAMMKGDRRASDAKRGERPPRADRQREMRESAESAKRRTDDSLKAFNEDLRKSSEESRNAEQRRRELDSRQPKRVDGKNLDPESKQAAKEKADLFFDVPRDSGGKASDSSDTEAAQQTELELLRKELEMLRKEVQALKKKSGGK